MKLGMDHPMGPLALADFIGLDVCLAILEVLHRGLGDDKYRPCPLLRRMVAAGHLGRKSGQGFYDYRETKWSPWPHPSTLDDTRHSATSSRSSSPRPELRLLRHHRDPRHHARARRSAARASGNYATHRGGDHRRAAAGARHDLQGGGGGPQPGRRQVGHHRRQQARPTARRSSARTAASSRPWAAATSPPRTSAPARRTWSTSSSRPSTSPASPGLSGDPSPVTAYGVYVGMKAAAKVALGQRQPGGQDGGGAGLRQGGVLPLPPPARGGRQAHRHRHRCRAR